MDEAGLEKVTDIATSVAETFGAQSRVKGLPEVGPPYNGVAVTFGLTEKLTKEGQAALNEALKEAGLFYDPKQRVPEGSTALKPWSALLYGNLTLEYVDMSTEHGRHMDVTLVGH